MPDSKEDEDWGLVAQSFEGKPGFEIPDLKGKDAVIHANDAVDYEDEDELAEDDDSMDDAGTHRDRVGRAAPSSDALSGNEDGADDDNDDDWLKNLGQEYADNDDANAETDKIVELINETHQALDESSKELEEAQQMIIMSFDVNEFEDVVPKEAMLKAMYPGFQPGAVLKMNSLFGPRASHLLLPKPRMPKPCVPVRATMDVQVDTAKLLRSSKPMPSNPNPRVVKISDSALDSLYRQSLKRKGQDSGQDSEQSTTNKTLALASAQWDAMLEAAERSPDEKPGNRQYSTAGDDMATNHDIVVSESVYDSELEDTILEGTFEPKKKVTLDMNDPSLLLVQYNHSQNMSSFRIRKRQRLSDRNILSRYNISNDRAYEMLKENYQSKVRSTIGNLSIDHSMVAMRLQAPHYKVRLSKAQMRSHHRPSFVVKPDTVIQFSKVKQRKKKKDKGKHITQLLNKTTDLTLGDSAQFFLLEYSEEFPLALSNFGMGSKIVNYYRKTSDADTTRPKLPTGETHVLSVQDRSAFWNFGFIEPGKVVPTLYNKMVRAPVFEHKTSETDFIMIRSTGGGQPQRYFLRPLQRLFVVGQTFPVTSIPGPHSRRVTTASKNRLKMIVYRVLNQSQNHRLQVRDISDHFPDQNDMQNRQRLKEFMEYQRSGDDQGFWKVKQGDPLPNEETIRSMISPEEIALLEAMQVGQQRLEDAGYGKTYDDDKDDQEGMSIEEQLAPWTVTRNFIYATQGKAMLQLHGEGDPTGRGEAFSFLKTSMKGGFKAMGESVNEKLDRARFNGHSYNVASQQKAYNEEISRIWYSQKRSLEITNKQELSWDEAEARREERQLRQLHQQEQQQLNQRQSMTPGAAGAEDDDLSLFSHGDEAFGQQTKVLRITRFIKDANGTTQRKVEIVKDPNVIRAYIKRKQTIEDSQLQPEDITVTNDQDLNRRGRKVLENELMRLQRNADRRTARKAMKENETGPQSSPGGTRGPNRGKATTRKCATCGAIGHIRTNKACPMYYDRTGPGAGQIPPPPTSTSNIATPSASGSPRATDELV